MAEEKSGNRVADVNMDVAVVLGQTRVSIEDLMGWGEGSVIELHKRSGEDANVEVNGMLFAKGQVVTVAEHFGVRLTQIVE